MITWTDADFNETFGYKPALNLNEYWIVFNAT